MAPASPRSGLGQPLHTRCQHRAHLPPPIHLPHRRGRGGTHLAAYAVRADACANGSAISPPPLPTGTHAVCYRPPVGALANAAAASARTGRWRPPDTRRKDRARHPPPRPDGCAHPTTQLSGRGALVDARGRFSPPPSSNASTRSAVGSRRAAAARKEKTGRIRPPPHHRPHRCLSRHSAGSASGGLVGTWPLVHRIPSPPPPGRHARGHRSPRGRRWTASWWPRPPAIAGRASGRPADAFVALIVWMVAIAETTA